MTLRPDGAVAPAASAQLARRLAAPALHAAVLARAGCSWCPGLALAALSLAGLPAADASGPSSLGVGHLRREHADPGLGRAGRRRADGAARHARQGVRGAARDRAAQPAADPAAAPAAGRARHRQRRRADAARPRPLSCGALEPLAARRGSASCPTGDGVRIVVPAVTAGALGIQLAFSGFALAVLEFGREIRLKRARLSRRRRPGAAAVRPGPGRALRCWLADAAQLASLPVLGHLRLLPPGQGLQAAAPGLERAGAATARGGAGWIGAAGRMLARDPSIRSPTWSLLTYGLAARAARASGCWPCSTRWLRLRRSSWPGCACSALDAGAAGWWCSPG